MNVPQELRYSREHEWVRVDGSTARIGITDFAQESLGDVVFVQLPDVGLEIVAGTKEKFDKENWKEKTADQWLSLCGRTVFL